MKEKTKNISLLLLCVVLGLSCSTKRNTSSTRAYHELKTRYNIFHNARLSYDNILEDQLISIPSNGFELLSFYPTSDVRYNGQVGGPFDIVIDKAERAISEHSISAKPRRDPTKAYSDDYRRWLNQEEFNPFISNVWLLLGKAHIQNGDYEQAVSVFSNMLRMFSNDTDVLTEVQIWMLRAYIEMNKFYDAQNLIYILETRKISNDLDKLFNETYAHYLVESQQFEEAASFIRKVVDESKSSLRKKWLQFMLGQVYTLIEDYENANKVFEDLKGLSTPKELNVYASAYQKAFSAGEEQADSIAHLLRQSIISKKINIQNIPESSISTTALYSSNLHRDSFQLFWEAHLTKNLNYSIIKNNQQRETERMFLSNNLSPHMLILLPSDLYDTINEVLFYTANFNFSNFKRRTFNITPIRINKTNALKLESFSSLDDASNYLQMLRADSIYNSSISSIITPIIISNENFNILQNRTLNDYILFYEANIDIMPEQLSSTVSSPKIDSLLKIETNIENIFLEEVLPLELNSIYYPQTILIESYEIKTKDKEINDLKSSLEQKAAMLLEQTKKSSTINDRTEQLKERERLREERIKQREQDLKEREREREREIKLREEERERKINEQNRSSR